MPRGKDCRETNSVAQLPRNYPHRGDNFESFGERTFTVGERTFTLGERTFTFGNNVYFGEITFTSFLFGISCCWGVLGLRGSGGPVWVFENI